LINKLKQKSEFSRNVLTFMTNKINNMSELTLNGLIKIIRVENEEIEYISKVL